MEGKNTGSGTKRLRAHPSRMADQLGNLTKCVEELFSSAQPPSMRVYVVPTHLGCSLSLNSIPDIVTGA